MSSLPWGEGEELVLHLIISKFNKRGRNAYGSRKGFCGGRSEAGRALRPSGSERGETGTTAPSIAKVSPSFAPDNARPSDTQKQARTPITPRRGTAAVHHQPYERRPGDVPSPRTSARGRGEAGRRRDAEGGREPWQHHSLGLGMPLTRHGP